MRKKNIILLLYLHQVFMFLQSHFHFFLYFVFTLVGQFFSGQTSFYSQSPPASRACMSLSAWVRIDWLSMKWSSRLPLGSLAHLNRSISSGYMSKNFWKIKRPGLSEFSQKVNHTWARIFRSLWASGISSTGSLSCFSEWNGIYYAMEKIL